MAFGLTKADARTELIYLAAIEGKTGSNGRHSPTRLDAVLNRKYRSLMSRVSQLGLPQFIESTAATAIPAKVVGEDHIDLPMAALTSEVVGVDVLVTTAPNNGWAKLDPISFEQRRDVSNQYASSRYCIGIQPPNGIGFWCVNKAPKTVNTTTITAGTIAIFPPQLTGSYKIHTVQAWTELTSDSNIFLLYEDWDEWFLNAAAMTCCQHDKNKADIYVQARDAFDAADARLEASAARLQRGGYVTKTPYRGIRL